MSEHNPSSGRKIQFAVAASLTFIAGYVDAIGYLAYAKVYTANMSGNSVAIGIGLGQQKWAEAAFRSWPVLLYVTGLILGRILLEIGAQSGLRRIASLAFSCEVVLLAIVGFSTSLATRYAIATPELAGIAILALAMGIQNAALTKFSSLTLHTGFVTGTLLKCAEQLVKHATWVGGKIQQGKAVSHALADSVHEPTFGLTLFLGFTWASYVIGAVLGTIGKQLIDLKALSFAIAGLVALIAVDVIQPLAVSEEAEQSRVP